MLDDDYWMKQAITQARQALALGEVPVGCVVVKDNQLIAEAYNSSINSVSPCAHAEINALNQAAKKIGNYRLTGTTVYVTLEPCAMCAGALVHARVKRLVIATLDKKTGACGSVFNIINSDKLNHQIELSYGPLQQKASQLLKEFFQDRRGRRD